nr:DDE-type integrase/transposase/recombinase [Pseudoflavonifractor phocaeensis]
MMQEMGIWAIYPKANLSRRNFQEAIVPYLLRNKTISFPNQVWSIDITYIKLRRSHMYLTAITDWYSRKIVGWNLSDTLGVQPVLETELIYVNEFTAPRQLQQAICGYVEDYNCLRPHEALDYATPDEVMTQVPVLPDRQP